MTDKLAIALGFLSIVAALCAATYPAKNEEIEQIGVSGNPADFNRFEVYTFKYNHNRCFVAVKQDGNIDVECP